MMREGKAKSHGRTKAKAYADEAHKNRL